MNTCECKLLTPAEAAAFLQIQEQTLAAWRCNSRYSLPFSRVGRSIRYKLSDLEKWVAARTVGAVASGE